MDQAYNYNEEYSYDQDPNYNQENDTNDTNDNNGIIECSSGFMETSIDYFPSTSQMLKTSNLDFGVICQPLIETEEEIPITNFSVNQENTGSVIRCRSCRAYINPYIEWVTNGIYNYWICNLCGISNELHSKSYYNNYLNNKCRELQYTSIDIIAPDHEYCVRTPQFPSYLFVINVNQQLIKANILNNICNTIKQIINDNLLQNNQETQIGFITYCDKIHFYSLKSSKPKMIVVNDINDALLPIPTNFIMANLSESKESIDNLLTILPSLHSDSSSSENGLGTAIECGFAALKEIGGKLICFSFGLSSLGKGKTMNRSIGINNKMSSEYEQLLQRSNNFFMDLSISLTKYHISCDLFQFTDNVETYCDISTIKDICRCSGGELFYYNKYNDILHSNSFSNDLYKLLTKQQGWESVMKIRCSKGISIKQYYGCFYRSHSNLLSIPTIDSDKTITALLSHSSSPNISDDDNDNDMVRNAAFIYIQSALLYTNSFGQRMIRCCTKRIPVTSSYDELFNNINLSVMTSLIAKQAVYKMLSKNIASSRLFIQDRCIGALQSYCKYCNISNGLKIENDYPLCLRYWPLNTLGLLKCIPFADIRDVSQWINIDQRVSILMNILHINHINIELLIRPSLYRIDNIINLNDNILNDEYYLPKESPLTLKSLSSNGLYLLDNGQSFIIFIGKNVNPNIIQTFLSNNQTFLSLKNNINDNKYIYKLYNILQYLQSINYRYQLIEIISETQREKYKQFATIYLIRDRTESVMSYHEFLQMIYKNTTSISSSYNNNTRNTTKY